MFNMIPPNAQVTPDNPYALTFDPGYVYGPKEFEAFGLRYTLK
jgi:outer membrane receptor for ferrienterochelin and colicins